MKLNTRSKCDRQIYHKHFTTISSSSKVRSSTGYTIIEILLIVSIIGIFSGIAVPAWIGFASRQQLRTGATRVYWAMRTAQSEAKRQKISVQASFREKDNRVQWAVHPASVPPNDLSDTAWESLPAGVLIDDKVRNDKGKYEASLPKVNPADNSVRDAGTVYRALFNYKGCPVYKSTDECTQTSIEAKGGLALIHKNLEKSKRCVIISTLIGVVRIGQEHKKANPNDRYCY
ncbi:MAG: type II secretion system protein [Lyngbya sp.]|nr:type II secretion system protein [Lyngbya sp.]